MLVILVCFLTSKRLAKQYMMNLEWKHNKCQIDNDTQIKQITVQKKKQHLIYKNAMTCNNFLLVTKYGCQERNIYIKTMFTNIGLINPLDVHHLFTYDAKMQGQSFLENQRYGMPSQCILELLLVTVLHCQVQSMCCLQYVLWIMTVLYVSVDNTV